MPVSSVTLDQIKLEITVGDAAAKLTATVAPENATDKSVKFRSLAKDISHLYHCRSNHHVHFSVGDQQCGGGKAFG